MVAAVGSYLDARHHGGRWLIRIEDLDTARVIPGSADEMLRTLEAFGLQWDGEVEYQSQRIDAYEAALDALRSQGLIYQCACSRKQLAELDERGYPGTCRMLDLDQRNTATRFRIDDDACIAFEDRFQGHCEYALRSSGDVIVRRRDRAFAYQLAVVVDDAQQKITDVVRGADLLDSTPWQIALQRALGFDTPRYAHLPLVVEPDGAKLSKSNRAIAADASRARELLGAALHALRQRHSAGLDFESVTVLLQCAANDWNPTAFQSLMTIPAPFLGRK